MPLTRVGSSWSLVAAFAVVALAVGCSSGGKTDETSGGDGGPELVQWCEAYKIINCTCQQCHQNPPLHGAPIPLMTYADTQAPFPKATSPGTVWQEMQGVIGNRFMPFTGDATVMPPVQPLTDAQQATILAWLSQGATDLGGQKCTMTCDWSKGPPTGNQ
jgi:hypothetical protein